ncbi:MAG: arginine--tRNA ligase [Bacteroidota bacterium]|nr:arginine--tRNA ligase [Bacteroidota bacterium]
MLFEKLIAEKVTYHFSRVFNSEITPDQLVFQPTRKEFAGDITLVVFGLAKISGKSPEETGQLLGKALSTEKELISDYNVIKGFLNISICIDQWIKQLNSEYNNSIEGGMNDNRSTSPPILVEYSSPNTNKPLHLGHIRNNLLGFSISEILKANGNKVVKVNIVNDRGIHICKSMLAWKKFGNGETPIESGLKGDHLVGKYYVLFDQKYKEQIKELMASGYSEEEAEKNAPLMLEAQDMLQKWEAGDLDTLTLWSTMNQWVYEGFDVTYRKLGVDFDKIYYESETYLLGKSIIEDGLHKGILYKKADGSVWVNLQSEGLDEKLLLRADGTSVYMTQDLGTAVMRYNEFKFDKLIYVVGNEQDYHFKVLFLVLKKLGYEWADRLFHLSYNMVDLPSGKMKSREGTVVDADELIDNMIEEAKKLTVELGKLDDFNSQQAHDLFNMLGLGALKYFLLRVDPEKRMLFNPNESIDFNGNTGPFIQYTHARIQSVLRKAASLPGLKNYQSIDLPGYTGIQHKEKELVKILVRYEEALTDAADKLAPSILSNYAYELARSFNQFYHEHAIIDPENAATSEFRLILCDQCARVIAKSMKMLGISVPDRM